MDEQKDDTRHLETLHEDDCQTVVLDETYRAKVTGFEHALRRFEAAKRSLRLSPRPSVRQAMTYVAGLSYRELPDAAAPAFLDLQQHAQRLNVLGNDTTSSELRALCTQRLHAIAKILQEHAGGSGDRNADPTNKPEAP